MCQDHCEAGVHHHQATITDWQRAWETSKVEPIPLEPVDRLMITCLIDNVVDPLAVNEGPAQRPGRAQSRQPCQLMRAGMASDPLRAETGLQQAALMLSFPMLLAHAISSARPPESFDPLS